MKKNMSIMYILFLKKLQEPGLYAKQEKYLFHQSMVEFLGYIVLDDGISMDFANFYRIFIKDYSKNFALLTRLIGKDKFIWNEKAKVAFEALKKTFTSALILVHADSSKSFFL
jgi:hypothetical protein